jgi:CheY-like chemotaxis protein
VLPAEQMVGLYLSYNNKRNNYSNDNDYKNNNLGSSSSTIPQIKPSNNDENYDNNNNDKPLAKLLIVDDDSDIIQVLKMGLLKNRFLVNAFTNPQEALQSFKTNAESYCLLLSDIRMPSMSGIQLARKVKEVNPNVKTVLMTAFEIRDNEFSKVFPSMQVDGFVQKPVGIKELTDKILSIIGETKRRIDGGEQ